MEEGSLFYMAPVRGVTDFVFRNSFAIHFGGFDLAVAPFISTRADRKLRPSQVKDVLPGNNSSLPVIPQILGNAANDFVYLANCFYDMGHGVVNWNLGCPFPRVAGKKRGSGLLPHTDMIREFLDVVIPNLKGGISIKTRLGWESSDDLFRLLEVIDSYPVEEVIIHPRTGVQRYDGGVDLDAFGRAAALTRHTVVYNGDIQTLAGFMKISAMFPDVRRWMIGRGALANPFLPSILKTGQDLVSDKVALVRKFHDDLFDRYQEMLSGPAHLLDRMKGLWRFFSPLFDECGKTMKAIYRTRSVDRYRQIVAQFFKTEAKIAPHHLVSGIS